MGVLQDLNEDKADLEMTPMIDVTFLLLIFFMCTIKFKTLEGKLAAFLPKDVGVNPTPLEEIIEKVEIVLEVVTPGTKVNPKTLESWDPDSGQRFNYRGRVIQYRVGPMQTRNVGDVQQRLKKLFQDDSERPATIDARQGVIYEDVVVVLDAAIAAGFRDITFKGAPIE